MNILQNINYDGIVYVPELKDETPVFKTKDEQVSWERDCYMNSNVLLFWVPRKFPSMLGLTTNVEFGYWLKSKNAYMVDQMVLIEHTIWIGYII